MSAADGLLPVGEAIALGLLAVTAWQIARNWDELWRDAEQILVGQEPEPQIYTTPNGEPGTIENTGHAPPEVETGTPGYDTESAPRTPNSTGHGQREQPNARDFVMESQNEREQLPPIVDLNPARLISRQTPAEMSKNRVNKLRKKIRKSGFDRNQPIEVVEVDGKLIIKDGHHRAEAAVREKLTTVPVRIYQVTSEDETQYLIDAAEAEEYRRYDY